MIVLFLATVAASAGVVMDVTDYDGGPMWGDAWITLHVRGDPAQLLLLQRVTWCKSLVPNSQRPPELALDCTGRNLMHAQLYPSISNGKEQQVVLKEPPTPPESVSEGQTAAPEQANTYYVNPVHVGGWDTLHQWLIVVDMSQRDGSTFRQVIRFNPITPLPTSASSSTSTTTTTTTAMAASESETTSATQRPSIEPDEPHGVISGGGVVHAWRTALAVLCVGVAVVAALGGTVSYLQRSGQRNGGGGSSASLNRQRAQAVSRAYAGSSGYQFGGGGSGSGAAEEIEMSDFSSEERRLQKEDMEILDGMH
jgi:hypothetical protein